MIEEEAKVVSTEPGRVWVETVRQSACGQCSARAGCGQPLMARVLSRGAEAQRNRLPVLTDLSPKVGDTVRLGIPETSLLAGAFWLYLAPVLALIVGAVSVQLLTASDIAALMGGMAGFSLCLLYVRRQQSRWQRDDRWRPRILGTIPTSKETPVDDSIAVKVL